MQDLLCGRKHPKILPSHLHFTYNYSNLEEKEYRKDENLQNKSICFMTTLRCKIMQDFSYDRKHPKTFPSHLHLHSVLAFVVR